MRCCVERVLNLAGSPEKRVAPRDDALSNEMFCLRESLSLRSRSAGLPGNCCMINGLWVIGIRLKLNGNILAQPGLLAFIQIIVRTMNGKVGIIGNVGLGLLVGRFGNLPLLVAYLLLQGIFVAAGGCGFWFHTLGLDLKLPKYCAVFAKEKSHPRGRLLKSVREGGIGQTD